MKYGQNGEVKRIGKRRLIVNFDEVEVASHGPWKVVECTKYSKDGWKTIKLYLDRPARKNVWRLGFKGAHASRSHDGGLLTAFYPDVFEWVRAVVSGEEAIFPDDDSEKVNGIFPVSTRVREVILRTFDEREGQSIPWSDRAQTKHSGRYIIPVLAQRLNTHPKKAKLFLEAMIRGGEIERFVVSKKTRLAGLRTVKHSGVANG